jgi:group I intron endonuclease
MIIYKTTNLINGKIYIGKDKHDNPKYLGSGKRLNSAIRKYGQESFLKEIIEYCNSEKHMSEREKYWISYYREKTRLTNYLNGGQGQQKGYKHTDEAKEKIREAAKKQFKGRFFKGMKFSEEINNKRKDALKKPVFQFSKTGELIKKWDGIIDASETLNIDQNAIQSVLKGKNIFSGGFHWSYNETHNIRKDIKFRAIYVINTITLEKKKFNSIKEASESLQIDRKEIDRGLKRKKEKNNLMFKYV